MAAYLVAFGTLKDTDKMAEYREALAPILRTHGGEFLVVGPAGLLAGDAQIGRAGIIRFPDAAALDTWYNSPEYQAIIPIREAAADLTLFSVTD